MPPPSHPSDRHPALLRWLVLALSCFLMIGNYYCYDNPAALKSQLQQHFGGYSRDVFEMRFVRTVAMCMKQRCYTISLAYVSNRVCVCARQNLLYTLYSIPNTVLPFFGGAFVDRFGINMALLLFSSLILVGQVIFASGSSFASFNLMLIGRFVVGLGGECLSVAQGALVVEWFKNEEIAFAMGLNLSISRLGSVINNELSPIVAEATNVSIALWVGVLMCIVSIVSVLLIVWINVCMKQQKKHQSLTVKDLVDEEDEDEDDAFIPESITLSDVKDFRPSVWLLVFSSIVIYGCVIPFNSVASSLLMERDYFKQPPHACLRCGEGVYADQLDCTAIASECPSVPPYAWPLPKLSANCSISDPLDQLNCSTLSPYIEDIKINCDDDAWKNGPLTKIYCEKKSEAAVKAATPMSIPYLISATVSPFLGFLVDRVGLRAFLNLVAAVMLIVVHSLLGLTTMTPFVPLILQGVAYTLFAAVLWPSIPLVVEEHHIGTGYGVLTAAVNIGLTFFPIVIATLYEHANRYIPNVELFFIALATLGVLNGVALNAYDWKHHWVLNRSSVASRGSESSRKELLPDETTSLLSH